MSPKVFADDGKNICIRPLCTCEEKDIARYAKTKNFPILEKACPYVLDKGTKRAEIKTLVNALDKEVLASVFHAMQNVKTAHFMDSRIFNFADRKQSLL